MGFKLYACLNKMGMYKHLKILFRDKKALKTIIRARLIEWRKQASIVRIDYPTNLISARSQGYKAKKGYILVRVRMKRGGKKRPQIVRGRRPKHHGQRLVLKKAYQWVAEERVAREYPNLEVLNSYKIAKDGKYNWFEVILVDPESPSIISDSKINWICSNKQRGRVFRGLTSAAKKSRGMRGKGRGYEKSRPSVSSNRRRGK